MLASSGYRNAAEEGARWTYSWFRRRFVAVALFAIFWEVASIVSVAYLVSIVGPAGLLALLVPHIWIGAFGIYWAIAHLVNHTTYALNRQHLVVSAGPMPWPSKTFPRDAIGAFDTKAIQRNNQPYATQVRVVDKNHRAKLLFATSSPEEAAYLAAELNHELTRQV